MKLTDNEKILIIRALTDYVSNPKDYTECDTPARSIAARVLTDSLLQDEAYYKKEDELTALIEEALALVKKINV